MSHNVFANVYYDFRSDSKFTPYLGIGIGLARVSVDYRTRWHRTRNADDINSLRQNAMPGGELNAKLAGVLSNDETTMSGYAVRVSGAGRRGLSGERALHDRAQVPVRDVR